MQSNILRNTLTILFVLTLTNIAASFITLHAVRGQYILAQRLDQTDKNIAHLTDVVSVLCANHNIKCSNY